MVRISLFHASCFSVPILNMHLIIVENFVVLMTWKYSPASLALVLAALSSPKSLQETHPTPGHCSHGTESLILSSSWVRGFQASSAGKLHPTEGFLGSFLVLWLYMSRKHKTWWKRLVEEIQIGTGNPKFSLKSLSHVLPAFLSVSCPQNHVFSSQLSH